MRPTRRGVGHRDLLVVNLGGSRVPVDEARESPQFQSCKTRTFDLKIEERRHGQGSEKPEGKAQAQEGEAEGFAQREVNAPKRSGQAR